MRMHLCSLKFYPANLFEIKQWEKNLQILHKAQLG